MFTQSFPEQRKISRRIQATVTMGFQRTILNLAHDHAHQRPIVWLGIDWGRFERPVFLCGHLTVACSSVHALRNFLYLFLTSNCTLERMWAVTFALCTRLAPCCYCVCMHFTERPRALMEHGSKKWDNEVHRGRNVIPILACHYRAVLIGVRHFFYHV